MLQYTFQVEMEGTWDEDAPFPIKVDRTLYFEFLKQDTTVYNPLFFVCSVQAFLHK